MTGYLQPAFVMDPCLSPTLLDEAIDEEQVLELTVCPLGCINRRETLRVTVGAYNEADNVWWGMTGDGFVMFYLDADDNVLVRGIETQVIEDVLDIEVLDDEIPTRRLMREVLAGPRMRNVLCTLGILGVTAYVYLPM
jgi:hypothetical protein